MSNLNSLHLLGEPKAAHRYDIPLGLLDKLETLQDVQNELMSQIHVYRAGACRLLECLRLRERLDPLTVDEAAREQRYVEALLGYDELATAWRIGELGTGDLPRMDAGLPRMDAAWPDALERAGVRIGQVAGCLEALRWTAIEEVSHV